MRANWIRNAWFADGWDNWNLEFTDPNSSINTVSSVKAGIMTGKGSPASMPTVGDSYFLMARNISMAAGIARTANVILTSNDSYTFGVGDIIMADFSCVWTKTASSRMALRIGYAVSTTVVSAYSYLYNLIPTDGTAGDRNYYRFAGRVTAPVTAPIGFQWDLFNFTTGTLDIDWLAIDNVRWFSAVDYLTPADANDTSGVS